MVCFLISAAVPLMKECFRLLMMKSPVESTKVEQHIKKIEHVSDVSNIHLWEFIENVFVASLSCQVDTDDREVIRKVHHEISDYIKSLGFKNVTIEMLDKFQAIPENFNDSSSQDTINTEEIK